MEHSPRAQELLTALCAAFPALRPLEGGDLPQVLTLYQRNTFYNSVALEVPPTLKSCQEDLAALPPGREPRHKLFLGLFQGEVLAAVLDLVEGYPDEGAPYIGLLELVPYGIILLVILFLLYKQPHMSGMILVCSGAAAVLFASGIRLYWFVGGGAIVGSALFFLITQTEYMTARMQSWLNPGSDLQGDGYQLWQSQIAIGSGGLLGTGLGNSRQKYMFLPEEHNDFVFAIVCEELGLIGACLIIILFALLIVRGYWLALHARDRFGSLMIVGINTQLAAQVILNIGVVTGALPTTGISLPFFSYGGTALMVQLAEVGLILAVSRQIVAPKEE